MSEPHLRVIDGDGEVILGDVVPSDFALLEEECRRLRRQVAALKGQIARLHKVDPQAELVEGILAHWRARCHGGSSRVLIPLDGARADAVRKMLRRLVDADEDPELASPDKTVQAGAAQGALERAAERIRGGIDALAAWPYEGKYGIRYTDGGPDPKERGKRLRRSVDITYLLKAEDRFERIAALVEPDPQLAYRAALKRMLDTQPNLRAVLASLVIDGHVCGEVLARACRWAASA